MNTQQLLTKFSQGITWNASSYFTHKLLTTAASFLLFQRLSTHDFSLWANGNSFIFLLLLWLDCGLRKSLPRFAPEFCTTPTTHQLFLRRIALFQLTLLLLGAPLLIYVMQTTFTTFHMAPPSLYYYFIGAIFLTEGIIALLRLMYHAHFWHKQFTIYSSISLIVETCILIFLITLNVTNLLSYLLATKLTTNIMLIIYSTQQLQPLLHTTVYPAHAPSPTLHPFIKHSAIMWFNTSIKSLTERNFMIPLCTYTLGLQAANLLKVTIDAALLFYRTSTKIIGTTDTSLLSHATITDQNLLPDAFHALFNRTITLTLPLLALCSLWCFTAPSDYLALHIFGVVSITYLTESLLSPFERLLEVKGHYVTLGICYIPYVISLILLWWYHAIPILGLVGTILYIQGARLSGSLLMTHAAYRQYHPPLPRATLQWIIYRGLPLYIGAIMVIRYSHAGYYVHNLMSSLTALYR